MVQVPARAFDYFEHRSVGSAAYARAKAAPARSGALIDDLAQVERRFGFDLAPAWPASPFGLLPLEFGDLPALAGDFTKDTADLNALLEALKRELDQSQPPPTELRSPRAPAIVRATRLEWFAACRWFRRADPAHAGATEVSCFRAAVAGDLGAVAEAPLVGTGYHAHRSQQSEYEQIARYISLASRNGSHFPTASWRTFRDEHRLALAAADRYRGAGSADQRLAALRDMLLHEGFAQHFLHDSFASGHIGTETSDCLLNAVFIGCRPTLARVQQTHDVLNEIGLAVYLKSPAEYLPSSPALRAGWTSSGDGHLYLPEAAFHRAVLLNTAAASVDEVLTRAERAAEGDGCRMCRDDVFPIPVKDYRADTAALRDPERPPNGYAPPLVPFREINLGLEKRSPDPRVPGLPVEGWKLGIGYGDQVVRRPPNQSRAVEGAAATRIDYVRPVGASLMPDTYGIEWWTAPTKGSSFLLNLGWTAPREVARNTFTIRAKAGLQTIENFTPTNPDVQRKRVWTLVLPSLEYDFEMYRPISVYLQLNLANCTIGEGRFRSGLKGGPRWNAGLRFDLAGI